MTANLYPNNLGGANMFNQRVPKDTSIMDVAPYKGLRATAESTGCVLNTGGGTVGAVLTDKFGSDGNQGEGTIYSFPDVVQALKILGLLKP